MHKQYAKGTLTGVEQVGDVDPYSKNFFNTFAWQGGVEIRGSGAASFNRGD